MAVGRVTAAEVRTLLADLHRCLSGTMDGAVDGDLVARPLRVLDELTTLTTPARSRAVVHQRLLEPLVAPSRHLGR
jgi:hypothetical protein